MSEYALTCSSCGGSGVVRQGSEFHCQYCGATVIPRLLPGTICADIDPPDRPCGQRAETLCHGCARPLCHWHGDPKRTYWMEPFDPRCLRLNWAAEDLAAWIRLNQPFHRFPLSGFEPFEWVGHLKMSDYAVGQLELSLAGRVKPLVESYGGDLFESQCRFGSLCATCEAEALQAIRKVVEGRRKIYRRVAYEARLNALLADARQALNYVEAFLHYPVKGPLPGSGKRPSSLALDLTSPAEEWEHRGLEAKERVSILEALKSKLGKEK